MTLLPTARVWRYMSFAKFVWMLQEKRLWLASADLLDDKWEVRPDSQQLASLVRDRHGSVSAELALDAVAKELKALRQKTFISCWTASEDESHALWCIYCPSTEGVAVQTTLGRLRQSVGSLSVVEVSYGPHRLGSADAVPNEIPFVARKKPWFAYEHEVRVVLEQDLADHKHPERLTVGTELEWDPEAHLEMVWVHPDAPDPFMETVMETVRRLAPKLSHEGTPLVAQSRMASRPPF